MRDADAELRCMDLVARYSSWDSAMALVLPGITRHE